MVLFEVLIPGRVGIKKNSKRIISIKQRLRLISSTKYMSWEKQALGYLHSLKLPLTIEGPLKAHFQFNFKNRQHQSDLDNLLGGPMDVLQKAGIIKNDNQICHIEALKVFGVEPSVRIRLYALEAA